MTDDGRNTVPIARPLVRSAKNREFDLVCSGWDVNADNRLKVVWFEGLQMPATVTGGCGVS